ncbi:DUF6214 family protein [Streptomyces sp. NPDC001135]
MRSCGYVPCVLEASFLDLSDRNAEDGAVSVWPAWKVREHGGTTSWYQVLLAFPDGARVEALAVLRDGRVSIEDVSAQPALSLTDLTVLAHWIEAPLLESCGVAVERSHEDGGDRRSDERHERDTAGGGRERDTAGTEPVPQAAATESVPEASATEHAPQAAATEHAPQAAATEHAPEAVGMEQAPPAAAPDREPEADGQEREPEAGGEQESALHCTGPRRARSGWPRGNEGRRLVAQEYRAAQQQGFDPVLAVMSATGHSRRRSLRLIAQARDAGYLTPRHARRD